MSKKISQLTSLSSPIINTDLFEISKTSGSIFTSENYSADDITHYVNTHGTASNSISSSYVPAIGIDGTVYNNVDANFVTASSLLVGHLQISQSLNDFFTFDSFNIPNVVDQNILHILNHSSSLAFDIFNDGLDGRLFAYGGLFLYSNNDVNILSSNGNIILNNSVGVNIPTPAYTIDINDSIGNSAYSNKNYIQLDDGNANMFFNAGIGGYTYIAISPSITASSFGHNIIPVTPNTIVIGNNQMVGINQITPQFFSLDVNNTIGNSTGDLTLGAWSNVTITPNANVNIAPVGNTGINTLSPRGKLDFNNITNYAIADVTTSDPTLHFQYTTGMYYANTYTYQFNVYAYWNTEGGTYDNTNNRVYSVNPLIFNGTVDNSNNAFYMEALWDATPNASGYRIVIAQDPWVGVFGNDYIDTPFTSFNIGKTATAFDDISGNPYVNIYPMVTTPTTLTVGGELYFDTGSNLNIFASQSVINGGNVGINNSTPQYALDVIGDGKFSGNLMSGLGAYSYANNAVALIQDARIVSGSNWSFAAGFGASCTGVSSFAFGEDAVTGGDMSFAIGAGATTTANRAFAIGGGGAQNANIQSMVVSLDDGIVLSDTLPSQFVSAFANGYQLYSGITTGTDYAITLTNNVVSSLSDLILGGFSGNNIPYQATEARLTLHQPTQYNGGAVTLISGGGDATGGDITIRATISDTSPLPAIPATIFLKGGTSGVSIGFIGINTITPSYTLDVNGDINFSGSLYHLGHVFTASLASTASYVTLSQTSSYITASNVRGTVTSSSYSTTASYALNAVSSSTSLSSSVAAISGGGKYYFLVVTGSGNQPDYIDTTDLSYNQATGQSQFTSISASSVTASLMGSSSYSLSSSYAVTASYASASSYTITASYASVAASMIGTASVYSQGFILTGSYTETINASVSLSATENGRLLIVNNGSQVTLTVPSTLPQGFACSMYQSSSGVNQIKVVGSGVNIRNRAGLSCSYGQYSVISLVQIDSGNYLLQGDMS